MSITRQLSIARPVEYLFYRARRVFARLRRWKPGACVVSLLFVVALLCSSASGAVSASSTPPFSGYLALDGWNDYARAEDHSELDVGSVLGESLTIEARVEFQYSPDKSGGIILRKPEAYQMDGAADQGYWHKDQLGFSVDTVNTSHTIWGLTCTADWSPGWHHVAGVYDVGIGQLRGYMDGKLLGEPWEIGRERIPDSPWWLTVSDWAPSGAWPGKIDEIRISNVARYKGETYTVPSSPFIPDKHTRALWHFDECEGATVFHDAGGAVDNVLVGYNGAHTEGVTGYRTYLPLVFKQH